MKQTIYIIVTFLFFLWVYPWVTEKPECETRQCEEDLTYITSYYNGKYQDDIRKKNAESMKLALVYLKEKTSKRGILAHAGHVTKSTTTLKLCGMEPDEPCIILIPATTTLPTPSLDVFMKTQAIQDKLRENDLEHNRCAFNLFCPDHGLDEIAGEFRKELQDGSAGNVNKTGDNVI